MSDQGVWGTSVPQLDSGRSSGGGLKLIHCRHFEHYILMSEKTKLQKNHLLFIVRVVLKSKIDC